MRYILSIILISIGVLTYKPSVTIYYVKNGGGTGSGLDDANAWSLAKLNTVHLSPTDSVVLKAGDVFQGQLTSVFGGTSGSPIKYGRYGTGANPLISAYTTLSSWTSAGGNIYYATVTLKPTRLVMIDGQIKGMGRYPNTGYNYYTSHGDSSITNSTIASIPFNPAGGEVVIRKYAYLLDRHYIKNRSSNTLNYAIESSNGYNGNTGVDSNGYFIQNHLGTLDQDGEWFNDTATNRLYVYMAGGMAGHTVKVSAYESIISTGSAGYLSFNNIDFEGGNSYNIYMADADYINIRNCRFLSCGGTSIYNIGARDCAYTNDTILNSLNDGYWGEYEISRLLIDGCFVKNSGIIPGAARNNTGTACGIAVGGDHVTVQNCNVDSAGYNLIAVDGDYYNISNNYTNHSCLVKDDGGNIYTFQGLNGLIANNTALNAIGAYAGRHADPSANFGLACGIYIDNGAATRNATVQYNTVIGGSWGGILNNGTGGNKFIGNNVSGFKYQQYTIDYGRRIRNIVDSANNYTGAIPRFIEVADLDTIQLFGSFKANKYNNSSSNTAVVVSLKYVPSTTNYTLKQWQAAFGHDLGSASNVKALKNTAGKILKTPAGKIIVISQ